MGCKPAVSQGNFIFVDIGRPAARVPRRPAPTQWVNVGRDFPPFEHIHVRISIGTMAEMKRATDVFREVLRPGGRRGGGGGGR